MSQDKNSEENRPEHCWRPRFLIVSITATGLPTPADFHTPEKQNISKRRGSHAWMNGASHSHTPEVVRFAVSVILEHWKTMRVPKLQEANATQWWIPTNVWYKIQCWHISNNFWISFFFHYFYFFPTWWKKGFCKYNEIPIPPLKPKCWFHKNCIKLYSNFISKYMKKNVSSLLH